MVQLTQAHSAEHLGQVRELFLEYEHWLGFTLCFQSFDRELQELPGEYGPPEGRLLLAFEDTQAVGCVALRKFVKRTGELKRLYVRPAFRGQHIGRRLAEAIIQEARQIGYTHLRLDTLPSMKEAVALYGSLGFRAIQPYRVNPIEDALYMELALG